jgi:hypothetical protein
LPISQEAYLALIDSPERFRRWLDSAFLACPELFPEGFAQGYTLKDDRTSRKLGLRLRRIECHATGRSFSVRPSFVLPYMAGRTDEVEKPLFLRRFGVPFWALARVFGRDPMYWYRLELSLGRNSVVGTTVRKAELPVDLLADEHHQSRDGQKVFIATVVAQGCCLGASVVDTADEAGLAKGYGVFRLETRDVEADYSPETVNTDGWQATQLAWAGLFPLVVILRCFLHGWLSIRDGCKKHPRFPALSEKVWHAYRAEDRRAFGQRLRRLREWAERSLSGEILARTLRLCGRAEGYGQAYRHPGGQRTSAMLDRVMRGMNGYFGGGQHLHGSQEAAERHARAWALLYNFAPWGPETLRSSGPWHSPAERLNRHRYHDNWLHNLLVSASLAGYRHRVTPPQTPRRSGKKLALGLRRPQRDANADCPFVYGKHELSAK